MTAPADSTPLDETAVIARDLIRLDTSNYGNGKAAGEREAAEYVAERLRRLGLEPRLFDSEPGRTSVVARVRGDDPSKPALVVHGHLDVVPADAANWQVDPFAGEIRDGMLWGRGAVDMKNMDAMILASLNEILSSGRRPARDLVVAFFADEEDGGKLGSHFLVREHPELFAGATEAISEVGGYSIDVEGRRAYLIQTGEKAMVWARLRATAPSAHGSRLIDDNAVTRLAEAVSRIGREKWPIVLTDTTSQLLERLADMLGTTVEQAGPDELVLRTGTAAGFVLATLRQTTNPTGLTAGYKHNVIPETAEATLDIRPLPGQEEQVLERVRELAGDDVEVLVDHQDVGLENPFEGNLIDAATHTLSQHDPGAVVLPYLMSGGTDNKALSRLGITGYGFAPLQLPADMDFPAMFHGVDERVPLEALVFGKNVLTDLLLTY